jgi:hypothetical protein
MVQVWFGLALPPPVSVGFVRQHELGQGPVWTVFKTTQETFLEAHPASLSASASGAVSTIPGVVER